MERKIYFTTCVAARNKYRLLCSTVKLRILHLKTDCSMKCRKFGKLKKKLGQL